MLGQFEAVHPRHLTVNDGQAESSIQFLSLSHQVQGRRPAADHGRLHAPGPGHFKQDPLIGGVVVHHQQRQVQQIRPQAGNRRHRLELANSQANRKKESAALPKHAFHPKPPAHQVNQSGRNGKPQPGPTVVSGDAAVRLGEGLEDHTLLLCGYADAGIRDAEFELPFVW